MGSQFYGDENNTLGERLVRVKALLALTFVRCGEDLLTHHSESAASGLQHESKEYEGRYSSVGGFLTALSHQDSVMVK